MNSLAKFFESLFTSTPSTDQLIFTNSVVDRGCWNDNNTNYAISPTYLESTKLTPQKIYNSKFNGYIEITIPRNVVESKNKKVDLINWARDTAIKYDFDVFAFRGKSWGIFFGNINNNDEAFGYKSDYKKYGPSLNPSLFTCDVFGEGTINRVYTIEKPVVVPSVQEFEDMGYWIDTYTSNDNSGTTTSPVGTTTTPTTTPTNTNQVILKTIAPYFIDMTKTASASAAAQSQTIYNSDMSGYITLTIRADLNSSSTLEQWNLWAFQIAKQYRFDTIGYCNNKLYFGTKGTYYNGMLFDYSRLGKPMRTVTKPFGDVDISRVDIGDAVINRVFYRPNKLVDPLLVSSNTPSTVSSSSTTIQRFDNTDNEDKTKDNDKKNFNLNKVIILVIIILIILLFFMNK
jgi:hypothetical protein